VGNRFLVNALDFSFHAGFDALDEVTAVARSEDRPAARKQSTHVAGREQSRTSGAEKSFKTVFDADDAHAVFARSSFHHRTDNGVESRCVAATCQDAD